MLGKHIDLEWIRNQVREFSKLHSRYQDFADVLYDVFLCAAGRLAPESIIQARPKTIPSFTEKALKKYKQHKNPLLELTDLCGARIIVQTRDEIEPVCDFIKEHFIIDWDNSVGVTERLKPTEFGYRSIHYIVQFKPGIFPTPEVNVDIPQLAFPDDQANMKAEIQVRTLLEHTWSAFSHKKSYKSSFAIPKKWRRELAVVMAILENADSIFARIGVALDRYASVYAGYMSGDEIREEIAIQELILEQCPDDHHVAHKIGQLALAVEDVQKAVDVLTKYIDSDYQPIVRDFGRALREMHRPSKDSEGYKQGQEYLQKAVDMDKSDVEAIGSLAGSWKGIDDNKALELYKQAFEIDPQDSYILGNYLELEILSRMDASVISLMSPAIHSAIERCREQVEVGMNYPWAFYDIGKFSLLLNKPYNSLTANMRAIQLSTASWMISTSLNSLARLEPVLGDVPVFEWVKTLFRLGNVAKSRDAELMKELDSLGMDEYGHIGSPVVILAGSTAAKEEPAVLELKEVLVDAFNDFCGTIISGGTYSGVCRLAGDIHENFPSRVRTIGYVPSDLPSGVELDKRYTEIRRNQDSNFTPLQPLHYWIDILTSGIEPSTVKLIGIGGGSISNFEYRLALMMGASVGILEGTEGNLQHEDENHYWRALDEIPILPIERFALRAFVGTGIPGFPEPIRENLAKLLHETYCTRFSVHLPYNPESLVDWSELSEEFRDSNRQAADYIVQKLNQIGCLLDIVVGDEAEIIDFTEDEVEIMAEMEHGRWMIERLVHGWKLGRDKSMTGKYTPYLVPWSKLHEKVKEVDRDLVREVPNLLAKFGLQVIRV